MRFLSDGRLHLVPLQRSSLAEAVISQATPMITLKEHELFLPRGSLKKALALHIFKYSETELFLQSGSCENHLAFDVVENELDFLGHILSCRFSSYPAFLAKTKMQHSPSRLQWGNGRLTEVSESRLPVAFGLVDQAIAREVFENYHYMGSYREDTSATYGLFRQGAELPFILCSISSLDRSYLLDLDILKNRYRPGDVMCISRVFGFEGAPHNSVSALLSLCAKRLKAENQCRAMVSAINPNLSFDGSSYRASAFLRFAKVSACFEYVNGVYATRRKVKQMPQASVLCSKTMPLPIEWFIRGLRSSEVGYLSRSLHGPYIVASEKYREG